MVLVLRALTTSDETALREAAAAWPSSEPATLAPGFDANGSFADYVELLNAQARGERLPDGWIPSLTFFGFVGQTIVGRLQLRRHLNDFLRSLGGHIGYVVLPAFRRRGYAKAMLQQGLGLARSLDLERVLITCDENNVASIRTIEGAGGALEDIVPAGEGMPRKRRYWIRLS